MTAHSTREDARDAYIAFRGVHMRRRYLGRRARKPLILAAAAQFPLDTTDYLADVGNMAGRLHAAAPAGPRSASHVNRYRHSCVAALTSIWPQKGRFRASRFSTRRAASRRWPISSALPAYTAYMV